MAFTQFLYRGIRFSRRLNRASWLRWFGSSLACLNQQITVRESREESQRDQAGVSGATTCVSNEFKYTTLTPNAHTHLRPPNVDCLVDLKMMSVGRRNVSSRVSFKPTTRSHCHVCFSQRLAVLNCTCLGEIKCVIHIYYFNSIT